MLANGTIEEGTVFWGAIDPRCIFKVLSSYAVIIAVIIAKIIATIAITTVIEKSYQASTLNCASGSTSAAAPSTKHLS